MNANRDELLLLVRNQMHDIPGQTGFSPYEICYGRRRPLKVLPYKPPIITEDAVRFFDSMERTREKIAEQLNHLHQSATDYVNSKRSRKQVYKEGEKGGTSDP